MNGGLLVMQPSKVVSSYLACFSFCIPLLCLFSTFFDSGSAHALTFKSDGSVVQNDKNNATSKTGKLTKSQEIKSFDVSISGSALENLKRLPFEFDFTKHEIWADLPTQRCAFKLERRGIENQRIELMASGRLRIEKGTVSFRRNKWNTGGMANKSFLQDEGNIKLLRGGTPVGKIPYFHLFVNQGEVARPPKYVELTKKREKGEAGSPEGTFSFYVDDWQEGLFTIKNCRSVLSSQFDGLACGYQILKRGFDKDENRKYEYTINFGKFNVKNAKPQFGKNIWKSGAVTLDQDYMNAWADLVVHEDGSIKGFFPVFTTQKKKKTTMVEIKRANEGSSLGSNSSPMGEFIAIRDGASDKEESYVFRVNSCN